MNYTFSTTALKNHSKIKAQLLPFHGPVRQGKCLYIPWHLPNRRRSTASQNGLKHVHVDKIACQEDPNESCEPDFGTVPPDYLPTCCRTAIAALVLAPGSWLEARTLCPAKGQEPTGTLGTESQWGSEGGAATSSSCPNTPSATLTVLLLTPPSRDMRPCYTSVWVPFCTQQLEFNCCKGYFYRGRGDGERTNTKLVLPYEHFCFTFLFQALSSHSQCVNHVYPRIYFI